MEKDEWFGIKKNNFYKEDGVEKVNYFQDVNLFFINIILMFKRDTSLLLIPLLKVDQHYL
jgi:hypothetical protein